MKKLKQLALAKRISFILSSACALAPMSASATAGIGINIGLNMSEGNKPELSYGFEAFALNRQSANASIGPLLQLNHVNNQGWQSTLALAIATTNYATNTAVMGQAGYSFRYTQRDVGLVLGANLELPLANLGYRYDFVIKQSHFSIGQRLPSLGGYLPLSIETVHGRPLRTDDNDQQRLQRLEVDSLATKWADMAQDEFEAIFAFTNLAIELLAANAPSNLIEQALYSAQQEFKHAKYCLTQAQQFNADFQLTHPKNPFRAPLPGTLGKSRLAIEGLQDGWLAEGYSAQAIAVGAKKAKDVSIKESLASIAQEETAHAELGRQIALWAIQSDATGWVRQQITHLKDAPLSVDANAFYDESAGFVTSAQRQRLAEQSQESLNKEINYLLAS